MTNTVFLKINIYNSLKIETGTMPPKIFLFASLAAHAKITTTNVTAHPFKIKEILALIVKQRNNFHNSHSPTNQLAHLFRTMQLATLYFFTNYIILNIILPFTSALNI